MTCLEEIARIAKIAVIAKIERQNSKFRSGTEQEGGKKH